MTGPLEAALRLQGIIDLRAALKARTPAEIATEERLKARMADTLAPLIDAVAAAAEDNGIPASSERAELLVSGIFDGDAGEQLLEVLTDEVGDDVLAAIDDVEQAVAAARKELPDELRPFGMDRRLFDTLSGLRDRMLRRMASRTVEAMVQAADTDLPVSELRAALSERLDGELTKLSRHALGDARNEATEKTEKDLGVTHHRWVTAGDDDVRPAHADVNGEVVDVGERFSNGWRRPGGVGCRCHLEPVLDEAA